MANDEGVRLLAYVVGGPAYDLPLAYCASGDQNANMRAAFDNGAKYYAAMGSVFTLAGLVPSPATPFLIVLGPLCLAVAGVFKAAGQGRSPSSADVAGIASAGGNALGAVGGDPTGGQAAEMAGAFAALAEFGVESGAFPPLPGFTPSANSRTARDSKKNALKKAKAKAKQRALLKAKKASLNARDDCRARGGVFDPAAPDGCRIVGTPTKKKVGGGGGKALTLAGLAVLAIKAAS